MTDPLLESARANHFILWEEVARDGAQARTLLVAAERVELARRQARIFGEHAHRHLVFAAGFPAAGDEEADAVRQVAREVTECGVASHGRATREDVDLNLSVIREAASARISLFFPTSDRMSHALLGKSAREAVEAGLAAVRRAVDRADGVHIDVAFADVPRSSTTLVSDAVEQLARIGVFVVKLCDTVGEWLPGRCGAVFRDVMEKAPAEMVVGAHLHNDLGLGLMNNLEAIRAGARLAASSWLGLGERCGLASTEELLFLLADPTGCLEEELGFAPSFFPGTIDTKQLVPIAQRVSELTTVPLRVSDPITGTGVNRCSTGTPFVAPEVFRPFDAELLLGVPREIFLTQLASGRVLAAVAGELGLEFEEGQVAEVLRWVKNRAFETKRAVVSREELKAYLCARRQR